MQVVTAILEGQLSLREATARYGLSNDELDEWIVAFRRSGEEGLRVTGAARRSRSEDPDRYVVAPEGPTWMVLDLEERRPAIVETTAMNGLSLEHAQTVTDTLNSLHRKLAAVLHQSRH